MTLKSAWYTAFCPVTAGDSVWEWILTINLLLTKEKVMKRQRLTRPTQIALIRRHLNPRASKNENTDRALTIAVLNSTEGLPLSELPQRCNGPGPRCVRCRANPEQRVPGRGSRSQSTKQKKSRVWTNARVQGNQSPALGRAGAAAPQQALLLFNTVQQRRVWRRAEEEERSASFEMFPRSLCRAQSEHRGKPRDSLLQRLSLSPGMLASLGSVRNPTFESFHQLWRQMLGLLHRQKYHWTSKASARGSSE